MLKALKVILIVYGAISVVMGVLQVFFPDLVGTITQIGEMPDVCSLGFYAIAMVGVSFIAAGVYLIIAGAKDILHHIYWVQFALLWAILTVAISLYSVLIGYVTFNQVMTGIIINGVFFILLMIFYPWGRTEKN
jgi:hypothetical protein